MSTIPSITGDNLYLRNYTNLFKTQKIKVWLSNTGLTASIQHLDIHGNTRSKTENLIVTGIPKEICNKKHLLKSYLTQTHLVPEKGANGLYERVSVHISGNWGWRAKNPGAGGDGARLSD